MRKIASSIVQRTVWSREGPEVQRLVRRPLTVFLLSAGKAAGRGGRAGI